MCERFVLDRGTADLAALFDVDIVGEGLPEPSWNIAPTQTVSIVLDSLPRPTEADPFPEPVRRLAAARFGLVPAAARDLHGAAPLVNARSEDVMRTASFAAAARKRRAVIPAAGYYEWRAVDGARAPVYVSLPGEELMLFAALYEWWRNPAMADDDPLRWLLSTTILTRDAASPLSDIQARMPVFLDADLVEEWLDPQGDDESDEELTGLIDQIVAGAAEVAARARYHQVSSHVSSVQSNGKELTAAVS